LTQCFFRGEFPRFSTSVDSNQGSHIQIIKERTGFQNERYRRYKNTIDLNPLHSMANGETGEGLSANLGKAETEESTIYFS
jgi:hypothetical protein